MFDFLKKGKNSKKSGFASNPLESLSFRELLRELGDSLTQAQVLYSTSRDLERIRSEKNKEADVVLDGLSFGEVKDSGVERSYGEGVERFGVGEDKNSSFVADYVRRSIKGDKKQQNKTNKDKELKFDDSFRFDNDNRVLYGNVRYSKKKLEEMNEEKFERKTNLWELGIELSNSKYLGNAGRKLKNSLRILGLS